MDLRSRLRSAEVPSREDFTLRRAFSAASVLLFAVLFLLLVALSLGADIFLVSVLASVAVAQLLMVVLPVQRIRAKARALYTGKAGEEVYEELEERGGRFR
ncbi:hypothetical protein [Haloarcula sediminis]|uniref:hypothetical protein n=1 Tax=Haloarcula sediminis TaxID=3111777 RepID=UPI002D7A1AEC|nr:hypothetical protein [Haloarcula sp. CK38]